MAIIKGLIKTLKGFETITLDELNSRAQLMKRQERKYLTTRDGLVKILQELQARYYLLEIENIRLFVYDNMYMDSRQLAFYHDHEASKEGRIKFRKRKYVDTGSTYSEYKVKTSTTMDKKRQKLDKNVFKHMDKKSREFFQNLYGKNAMHVLPTMQTTYQRITLCSKTTEERLTIDLNLVFNDPQNPDAASIKVNDFVIIEVKQKVGSRARFCKDVIEKHGGRLAEGCSKYCIGLIFYKKVKKFTHFQKTINFIKAHGGVRKVRMKKTKMKTKKKQ